MMERRTMRESNRGHRVGDNWSAKVSGLQGKDQKTEERKSWRLSNPHVRFEPAYS